MKKHKFNSMTSNFKNTNMKNSIFIFTLVVFMAACGSKSSPNRKAEL
jgi:hypothetical protein